MIISKRKALCVLGFLAAVCVGYWGWIWYEGLSWHRFQKPENSAPQVHIRLHGPDYAYHIGDIVTATITVKQQAGTVIEWENFGLRGDFEVRSKTPMATRRTSDGGTCYRFDVVLQSVKVATARSIALTGTWLNGTTGAPEPIKHQPLIVYGSNTYDGRTQLQEGVLEKTSVVWLLAKSIACLTASFAIFCWIALRGVRQNQAEVVLSEHEAALIWLNDLWERIEQGQNSGSNYQAIEAMLRRRWDIEAAVPDEIGARLARPDIVALMQEFLRLSRPAIYSDERPDAAANARLKELSQNLLSESFKTVSAPAPPQAQASNAGGAAATV